MSVDRGGLRYVIAVDNQFSGGLRDFKTQVAAAGRQFDDFKNRIKGSASITISATKGLNQLNQAIRRTANSQTASAAATEKANKANQDSITIDAQLLAQKKAIKSQLQNQNSLIGGIRKEQAAVNALATAYKRLAAAKKQAGVTRTANINISNNTNNISKQSAARAPGLPKKQELRDSASGFQAFQGILQRTQSVADRASSTIQRLFTALLAFAAIRSIVNIFTDLIGRMITFNATVERSILAISSLILSTGQVRDATNQTVDAALGLALAQKEARKQTDLLRKDAIQTAATFEQLLETFQTAIGPGLQAGLSLNDIRKFTVQVSQAAAAIGLPQNQLAEEIRSLLSGTINIRNTRIAATLGITNEDIRRAKEQGNLLGFLQKRFNAFTLAGQEALNTFDVLLQQVNEGLTLIIGAGGIEFFTQLKGLLRDVFDTITSADPITGLITPNPEAVRLVRQIADALVVAVQEARNLGKELGFSNFKVVASAIAGGISTASKVLSGFVEGFVKGINTIFTILTAVGNLIERYFGKKLFDEANLQKTVANVTQFLTVFLSIILAAKTFAVALAPIAIVVGSLVTAFGALKAVLLTVVPIVTTIGSIIFSKVFLGIVATVGIVGLLGEGLRRVLGYFFDIDLKAVTLLKIIGALASMVGTVLLNSFKLVFLRVTSFVEFLYKSIIELGSFIIDSLNQVSADAIAAALGAFASALEQIPEISQPQLVKDIIAASKEAKTFAFNLKRINDGQSKARRKELSEIVSTTDAKIDAYNAEIEAAKKLAETTVADAILANEKAPTVDQLGEQALNAAKAQINSLVAEFKGLFDSTAQGSSELAVNVQQSAQEVVSIVEVFENLPAVISGSSDALKRQVEAERDLTEEIDRTNDAYREGVSLLGLTGRVQQQRQEQFKIETGLREKTIRLIAEEKGAQEALRGIQFAKEQSLQRFLALSRDQQNIVNAGVEAAREDVALRNEISRITTELAVKRQELKDAEREGNADTITAAKVALDSEQKALNAAKERQDLLRGAAQELVEAEDPETQKKVVRAIEDKIALGAQEESQQQRLVELQQARFDLERLSQQAANSRISLLAKQEAFELESATRIAKIQADAAKKVFESRNDLPSNQRLIVAENEVRLAEEQIRQAQRLRDINLENAQIVLNQSRARADLLSNQIAQETDGVRRNSLQKSLNDELTLQANQERLIGEIKDSNAVKTEEERLKLEQVNEQLLQTRLQLEQPLQTGILDGFRQAAQEIPTIYEGIVSTIKNTLSGFTDFISTAIVDAFDPTKDLDIKERFARFLQDIAKQVIQLFTQLAIARAILGLGFLGGGGGLLPFGSLGFNKGGEVPHSSRKARGFNEGGLGRPAHIHPSDTIPAWLTPGEHVMPVKRVSQYGADLFEALRRGLIDPTSIRAAAGLTGRSYTRVRPSFGPGFAAGGVVASKASAPNRGSGSSEGSSQSGPTPAFVVANDQNAERLLSGGSNGVLNFMRANAGRIKQALNVR